MLEIANLTHGQILNFSSGAETPEQLVVPVCGIARAEDAVRVNGVRAARSGEAFSASVPLTEKVNDIVVTAAGNRGEATRSIKVIWDRKSFKRINFCIDDNIYTFAEIARMRPASIFDHFYLKRLRELHEKYDLKLTLNLFFEDARGGFTLADFPDCYRDEFRANADWLKLAFHARSEFPDRIYQNADVETLLADFDRVKAEICRFAGEEAYIAPANIHWSMVKTAALPHLRERGVRFLGGLFFDGETRIGEARGEQTACDVGYFENEENALFIQQKKVWHDFRCNITMGIENLVLNLEEMPVLEKKLAALFGNPENQALHMLTHEQYCFPFYKQYLPDHFERMELMAKMAKEAGYKFVFFSEGFLGNPAQ